MWQTTSDRHLTHPRMRDTLSSRSTVHASELCTCSLLTFPQQCRSSLNDGECALRLQIELTSIKHRNRLAWELQKCFSPSRRLASPYAKDGKSDGCLVERRTSQSRLVKVGASLLDSCSEGSLFSACDSRTSVKHGLTEQDHRHHGVTSLRTVQKERPVRLRK